MSLPVRAVADGVSVAPQLGIESMAEARQAGFRSVVNNRPDFEHGPDQPASAEIAAAAAAEGLQYRHLPVDGAYQSPEQAAALKALLAELPGPVLLFCRSGARSARLYQLSLDAPSA